MANFSPGSEHPSSDYADDEDENDDEQDVASEGKDEQEKKVLPLWTVVCSTEVEWQQLAESFKKSKHKDEKLLYETLSVDFVPEIGKMIEAKVLTVVSLLIHVFPQMYRTCTIVTTLYSRWEIKMKYLRKLFWAEDCYSHNLRG